MRIVPATVLKFWFGGHSGDANEINECYRQWFGVDAAFDAEIRARFGAAVATAGRGELHRWKTTAKGLLAVILLLDQFPRNIFRGTANAFKFDATAQTYCRDGIERGLDRRLNTIERTFFYLPLEHAEDAKMQAMSIKCYREMHDTTTGELAEIVMKNLNFAQAHFDLIERFGRFPLRNAALGRVSTTDELAFLNSQANNFGQR